MENKTFSISCLTVTQKLTLEKHALSIRGSAKNYWLLMMNLNACYG